MVLEELQIIEQLGVGGAAFFLVYLLLKNMQQKVFEQSEKMLALTETVIQENTKTLQHMSDAFESHTRTKEALVEEFKECKRERDGFLRRLEDKVG